MAVELDAAAFKALSSKTRVELLKRLREKPRSPTSLSHETGLSVQAVDEHLRKLAAAGLAEKRKHAKWTYYALTPAGQHLVSPSRQPVYVLLSISFLLLAASALTFMDMAGASAEPGATALPAAGENPPAAISIAQEAAALPAPALSTASDTTKIVPDARTTDGASQTAESPASDGAPLEAVLPNRELPWAELFGFAGVAALVAALVLWVRQTNRF